MNAFTLEGWDNFFVAAAGAAASLAGLVFVALSINLAKILAIPGLAARAGETILPLALVLLVSLLALAPGQRLPAVALEMIGLGGLFWVVTTWMEFNAWRARHFIRVHHLVLRIVTNQAATFPVLIGGLSLLLGFPGGLYWLLPAVLMSFAGAMNNAWILLVEILR